jgi:predicted O-methyltransferase YrrM
LIRNDVDPTVCFFGRTFQFGRVDGSSIGVLTLRENGSIDGYRSRNEQSWAVDNGCLVFRDIHQRVTTVFEDVQQRSEGLFLRGAFLPLGPGHWHTLTELNQTSSRSVIDELRTELYGEDQPLSHAKTTYRDNGYPHTNLVSDIVDSVLDFVQPRFWLELGSMLGGSAIRVASLVKSKAMKTEIVCVDPFTGDVNMWAWEQPDRKAGKWQFLRLEHGRPTIYDRFLANVVAAGHADIILPIAATSTVGLKLLSRLLAEGRLSRLPEVIYLDSAHEPDETFLELRNCWNVLPKGGILLGDDWGWEAVRNDVTRFAQSVVIDPERGRQLAERHGKFAACNGILLDAGHWVLTK